MNILNTLNILISFIIGLLIIGVSLGMIDSVILINFLDQIKFDSSVQIAFALFGLLIILFPLRYAQADDKNFVIESPAGKIRITFFAIEEMIRRVLENNRELSRIKPQLFWQKNILNLTINAVLIAEVNLIDLTSEIQQNIKDKLAAILGNEEEIKINIKINKIILPRENKTDITEEKEPEIPYRQF